jgi:intein/homing endonuclease
VPIEEVRPGDTVHTPTGVEVCDGAAFTGNRAVLSIATENGTAIEATHNHLFLVERNGSDVWVRADEIKTGDALVVFDEG